MLLQSADCLITPCVRDLDPGVYSGGGGGGVVGGGEEELSASFWENIPGPLRHFPSSAL